MPVVIDLTESTDLLTLETISNLAETFKNSIRQLKASLCLDSVGRIDEELINERFSNCKYEYRERDVIIKRRTLLFLHSRWKFL
jgi:hypothetical protein